MGRAFVRGWRAVSLAAGALSALLWVCAPSPIRVAAELWRLWREPPAAHLPVPVEGLSPRHVSNSWGAPRSRGRRHQGIDLFAGRGRPVRSTTRGVILDVGEDSLGGHVVRVLGPGWQVHYYAHLESFGVVRRGDVVPKGTVLGTVGDSGNARGTPCHLHYGIYSPGGTPRNPYPLLVAGEG